MCSLQQLFPHSLNVAMRINIPAKVHLVITHHRVVGYFSKAMQRTWKMLYYFQSCLIDFKKQSMHVIRC